MNYQLDETILRDFPQFKGQTFEITPNISGHKERIFQISEQHVAKIVRHWRPSKNNRTNLLQHECEMTTEAYQNGLSVPRPEGIYAVTLFEPERNQKSQKNLFPIPRPGSLYAELPSEPVRLQKPQIAIAFVMQYIKGSYPHDSESALELYDLEIAKAKHLGFIPGPDQSHSQSLWVPEEEKIYLLDLEYWTRRV